MLVLAGVVVGWGTGEAGELKLELAGDGKPVFVKSGEIAGLSGVTWCGGDSFAAVSDREPVVVALALTMGPTGGRGKAAAGVPVGLATRRSDCEGIAWVVGEGRFYVSAEGGPGIQGFGRADGKAGPMLKLPEVFGQARGNLSLESLTFESTAGRFWTANEEALTVDGPVAQRRCRHPYRDRRWCGCRRFRRKGGCCGRWRGGPSERGCDFRGRATGWWICVSCRVGSCWCWSGDSGPAGCMRGFFWRI